VLANASILSQANQELVARLVPNVETHEIARRAGRESRDWNRMATAHMSTPYRPTESERVISCISHLAVFLSTLGWFIAIGLWIYARTRHPYAAFQAAQAVIFQFVAMVVMFAVGITAVVVMSAALGFGLLGARQAGELAFGVIGLTVIVLTVGVLALFSLLIYGYAIYAAVRAYQGRSPHIPGVAALADAVQPAPPVWEPASPAR
jgi:uncharacterized Tic20 family protein